MRIDTIEHPGEDLLAALDDDAKNRNGNDQSDDWVDKRIAKPDTKYADEHREAGPAIDAGMMTIGNERGATNAPSNANTKNRDRFVSEKTDRRSNGNRPQM
jgi:hypothetical protein